MLRSLIKLARPTQWSKSVFVLVGPAYHVADMSPAPSPEDIWWDLGLPAFLAAAIFALVSSAGYIINDIRDVDRDRAHPRKKNRPIASGAISVGQAMVYAAVLLVVAGAMVFALDPAVRILVALSVLAYFVNVSLYSYKFKRVVITDVMCLALGFVIRVIGGCAAVPGVSPSSWILICTFFLAMFLAFGKRLGERRVMADQAATARVVQTAYTDDLLRMLVVVTGVGVLLTYALYIAEQEHKYMHGFNLLLLTLIPATYGLMRCLVLLERGEYDDPTELAVHDRPFQAAAALFALITLILVLVFHQGRLGDSVDQGAGGVVGFDRVVEIAQR